MFRRAPPGSRQATLAHRPPLRTGECPCPQCVQQPLAVERAGFKDLGPARATVSARGSIAVHRSLRNGNQPTAMRAGCVQFHLNQVRERRGLNAESDVQSCTSRTTSAELILRINSGVNVWKTVRRRQEKRLGERQRPRRVTHPSKVQNPCMTSTTRPTMDSAGASPVRGEIIWTGKSIESGRSSNHPPSNSTNRSCSPPLARTAYSVR